ncbi:DUF6193 family natural product biosynthesis protein [Kitasatospora sp. NBC_01560]|uniref:DUF6193 family natural product biosynthesis protein n=1 Tax=Kitasatospora sp. NBC_01560 TaxID=2975965 RepID=UPI00387060C7
MTSSTAGPAPETAAEPPNWPGTDPGHRDGNPATLTDLVLRTAAELGLPLPAPEADSWERTAEFRTADGRRAVVRVFRDDHCYLVQCRGTEAWLAYGRTTDPAAATRAAAAWAGGADLRRTQEEAPFLDIQAWAFAHEREPLDAVELAWRQRLDSVRQPPWDRRPRVRTLVEAAFDQPALRRLTPVTSHYILWFSSSPSLPYARVGCSIDPHHNGKYGVRDRGEIVARTDTAEEAVALAVAALPPHLRSAD